MKKLNAFQMKLIMAFLMVFDHLHYIPGLVSGEVEILFHLLTRCVGVWFAYMAVEGFIHTRNRLRYNLRLFGWAGAMLAGNLLLNRLFAPKELNIDNNIFMTIAVSVFVLNLFFSESSWEAGQKRGLRILFKGLRILLGVIAAAGGLFFCEGGIPMIPFVLLTYLLRKHGKIRNAAYLLLALSVFGMVYVDYGSFTETVIMLLYNCDWAFVTVIPFLYLYDGTRGPKGRGSKYFFYLFYPAHLWLIYAIAYFLS